MTASVDSKCPFTEEQLKWLRDNLDVYLYAENRVFSESVRIEVGIRLGGVDVSEDEDTFSVST